MESQKNNKLNNNHIVQKKGRGGARPGAGRKKGSHVKLSAVDILNEIAKQDVPFAVGLAQDYMKARQSGDLNVIQRYQQMLLNKVVADKQELDLTSNGETLGVAFTFGSQELSDWNELPKSVKLK